MPRKSVIFESSKPEGFERFCKYLSNFDLTFAKLVSQLQKFKFLHATKIKDFCRLRFSNARTFMFGGLKSKNLEVII
ncbi:hypothetical protein A9507_11250 [Methanobacterium sp. A39]|uniref:Uncharacterized protein n=1 Tax=Methanobacterium bryantii TaxID=2161 RepID=A0A2A2H1C0_METBR|nr:hypothetical protein A9507_11250 [Methanobacterium sp. A39]PAV03182.1 hypothetical protein ASJ80_07900 [Methanobacterium bryantii]